MGRLATIAQHLLTARGRVAYRLCLALLFCWAALLVTLVVRTKTVCHTDMPWDTMSLLDGAYRMFSGQIPNVDFFSPIGILPLWLIELGMKWGGVNAHAFALGTVLAFVIITPLAWWVASRRFPAVAALLLSMFIGGLVIARRPLPFGTLPYNFEFSHLSYAMWYNRLGWSLLALFALYWLLPPFSRKGAKWVDDAEAFAMGAVFALLAISKANYIAGALGVMLFGCCFARPSIRRFAAYVAGAVVTPVGISLATGWTAGAWWRDLVELTRMADVSNRAAKLITIFPDNATALLLFLAAIGVLLPLLKGGIWREGGWGRTLILGGACGGIGLAVLFLNTQYENIPLLVIACALVLETALRRWNETGDASGESRLRLGVAACITLVLLGNTLISDTASVVYAWTARNHLLYLTPPSGIITTPSLQPLLLPPQRNEQVERAWVISELYTRSFLSPRASELTPMTSYQFAHIINDGVELLQGRTTPESRIFCLSHNNPFPLALQLPPPSGGNLWWDAVTFTVKRHPDPATVFADVTHVLVRRVNAGSYALEEVYLPYVREHFQKTTQSALWELYEKAPGNGTAAK